VAATPTPLRGTPVYSTTNPKFGTHAFLGDGTVCMTAPAGTTDAFIGGGIGTLEYWCRTSSTDLRVAVAGAGGAQYWFGIEGGRFRGESGFGPGLGPLINDGAWHHIAIDCNALTYTAYVDGVAIQTINPATGYSFGGTIVVSGFAEFGTIYDWVGGIDEVRYSSIRRYTAAFTPSAAPFTRDASTNALYHLDGSGIDETAAPVGFTATAVSATQVDLAWTASAGYRYYQIERNGTLLSARVTGTTYSDTGLTANTPYSYRIRAEK
jgi:hypothetical protein